MSGLLRNTPVLTRQPGEGLLGVLVPHGPLKRVGDVMAFGYRAFEGRRPERIILLLASHERRPAHVATLAAGVWATPLRKTTLDQAAIERLVKGYSFIRYDPELFHSEPVSEVQLPFLQLQLSHIPVVPLLIGDPSMAPRLAAALRESFGFSSKTLMIASSNLLGNPTDRVDRAADERTLEQLKNLDPAALTAAVQGGGARLCGLAPVSVLFEIVAALGAEEPRLLAASGGAAAMAFVVRDSRMVSAQEVVPRVPPTLDWRPSDRQRTLKIVRRHMVAAVGGRDSPYEGLPIGPHGEAHGVFITLTLAGHLRGSVGFIKTDEPLGGLLPKLAVAVTREDPRFPRLKTPELQHIRIEVSILTPAEPLPDPLAVRIGREGLIVRSGGRRSVLLPQLAMERGWDAKTFVRHACRRAGLPLDCWRNKKVEFERFEVLVVREKVQPK